MNTTATSRGLRFLKSGVLADVMKPPPSPPEFTFGGAEDMMCRSSESAVSSLSGLKKDKQCLVCGDKALGYNFNAISCESCKAFFRRNAHKTIRGRCEGKCDVNVESRSFCKRCRLAKCFTVGMRKDMILNEEQKKQRKQKIIYNKLRRQGHMPPQDTYSSSPKDLLPSSGVTSPFSCDDSDVRIKLESAPSPQASTCSSPGVGTSFSYPSWADSQELVSEVISQLSPEQQRLIKELRYAMQETAFLASTSTSLRTLPTNPTEFINIAEVFVRKVIKVAKHVAVFKTLHRDDQIALLKGSVVDIMMLRSAVNYDPHTETWNLSTMECLRGKPAATATSTSSSFSGGGNTSPGVLPDSPSLSAFSGYPGFSNVSPAGSGGGSPAASGINVGSPTGSPAMAAADSPSAANASSPGSVASFISAFKSGQPGNAEHNRISAELLKRGSPETLKLFMTYSKFIKSLMSSIHGDLVILKILIMMSLFSADRSSLQQREQVQQVQEHYATLLQSYCSLRFPEDKTLFARLVMKLTDLRNINEVHSKMLLKMKVEDMEPLLLEVFDLPS